MNPNQLTPAGEFTPLQCFDLGSEYDGPWVYLGQAGGVGSGLSTISLHGGANDLFGIAAAAAGDANNDGVTDLLIGAPAAHQTNADYAGEVHIVSAADGSTLRVIRGAEPMAFFGRSVAHAGDVDGDGAPDYLIGDWEITPTGPLGRVHVVSGATGLNIATIVSDTQHDGFGYALAGLGDVDGDGLSDIAISAPLFNHGHAYLFLSNRLNSATAPITRLQSDGVFINSDPTLTYGVALTRVESLDDTANANILITSITDDPTVASDRFSVVTQTVSAGGGLIGTPGAPQPLSLDGDVDGNGIVDGSDLVTVIANYGNSPGLQPHSGDVTGDGVIDGNDLVTVTSELGAELAIYSQTLNDGELAFRLRHVPRYTPDDQPPYPFNATGQMPVSWALTPQYPGVHQPGRIEPITMLDDVGDATPGPRDPCEVTGGPGSSDCDGDGVPDDPPDSNCDGIPDEDDEDGDGIPDDEDCDSDEYQGDKDRDCACQDDNNDGVKNQDDCQSTCFDKRAGNGNSKEECCE